MSWLSEMMTQFATYWAPPASGNAWGYRGSFTAPELLSCRWENKLERFIRKDGTEASSLAIVYLPSAVEVGGYLFEGESTAADPRQVANARLIARYDESQSIDDGDEQLGKAYL